MSNPGATVDPSNPTLVKKISGEDRESRALALELLKEQRRKLILDERLGGLKSLIPASASKGREGTVTVAAGAGFLTEWVGRTTVTTLAQRIADSVMKEETLKDDSRVLVVESLELLAGDWKRMLIQGRLSAFSRDLDTRTKELTKAIQAVEALSAGGPARLSAGRRRGARANSLDVVRDTVVEPDQATGPVEATDPDSAAAPGAQAPVGASNVVEATAGSIAAVFGGAADVLSMFRSDYDVANRDIALSASSLAAQAVAALRAGEAAAKFSFNTFSLFEASETLALLLKALGERDRLVRLTEEALGALGDSEVIINLKHQVVAARAAKDALPEDAPTADQEKAAAALKEAEAALEKERASEPPGLREARAKMDGSIAQIAAVNTELGVFMTPPADGSGAPIISAGILDRLRAKGAGKAFTHVLYVAVDDTGGEIVTRKGLFQPSGRVNYIGGAAATWILITTEDSAVAASGTEAEATSLAFDLGRNGGALRSIDKAVQKSSWSTFGSGLWRHLVRPLLRVLAVALIVALIVILAVIVVGWIPALLSVVQTLVAALTPP